MHQTRFQVCEKVFSDNDPSTPVWQTGSEYCCFSRIFSDLADSRENLLRNNNGETENFDNHVEFHKKTSKTIILIIVMQQKPTPVVSGLGKF